MVQGELFRDESSISGLGSLDRARKPFLSRHQLTIPYDKLLLVLIAWVVVFALTYSFGVEHGKRAVEKSLESLLPAHTDTVSLTVEPKTSSKASAKEETVILVNQEPAVETEQVPRDQTVSNPPAPSPFPVADLAKKGSYTVQLVTYADEKQAIREIDHLKTKGQEGFVIPSGHYYQVCANYFDDKVKARNFLKQFRELSRYPDAYVRPVVR